MSILLTLGFDFEDSAYYSVIVVKENMGEKEYKITIMNGALQQLLIGNNTILEQNGELNLKLPQGEKIKSLKLKIGEALGLLLRLPIQVAN